MVLKGHYLLQVVKGKKTRKSSKLGFLFLFFLQEMYGQSVAKAHFDNIMWYTIYNEGRMFCFIYVMPLGRLSAEGLNVGPLEPELSLLPSDLQIQQLNNCTMAPGEGVREPYCQHGLHFPACHHEHEPEFT